LKGKKKEIGWREVVKEFRELGGMNLCTAVDNWLKYKKLDKLKPTLLSFTPTINPKSRAMDKLHIKNYLENSLRSIEIGNCP